MKYIKVLEVDIDKNLKFDKYNYYSNGELKEIELNKCFTLTKKVLSKLLELNNTNKITIIIRVINDKLSYFIGYDNAFDINFSNIKVKKIELTKKPFKYRGNLYGVVNPLNINLKEVNIIDEILIENRGSNFSIEIDLIKDIESKESSNYLSVLADLIEELSSKSEININEKEHIFKRFGINLFGGEGKSFKKERVDGKKQITRLKEKYEVLANDENKIICPTINILAEDIETYKMIQSKLISFSKMNIGNSIFYISKEKDYVEEIKYCTLDYIIPIIAFPTSDVAGLNVRNGCEYGASILDIVDNSIQLGKLNKNGPTVIDVNYDVNDLLMHTFITGVTGSGKTSTVKKIISEIYKKHKPFLIMEPAKSEYKFLSKFMKVNRYCLGIEGEKGFRLNPFEFPNNIHIQTHLDNIKSVFVAAFPMQGPMPYILETALYNIYRKVGWDLISSINIYSKTLEKKYLYPTLEDLYNELDNVTEKIGYSKELTDDVKGALKVRIGSLLSGAKGIMLNTNISKPMQEILTEPTIIELEGIGDSQEKVFLMGLILTSMYEYYVSKRIYSDELQNLLIIEEAHRLLENISSTNNNEIADMKGKALENFNNILSEIRAYGQGIVVADQIPSKISTDVIKNTNLKIIHRLYANDDRELVGESIGLDKEKIDGFINLERGQAVVFHSKLSSPIKSDIVIDDINLLNKINEEYEDENINLELKLQDIILKNDTVINDIAPIINSYLISNDTDYKNVRKIIKEILFKYYDEEILNQYKLNVDEVIKEILIKYIKSLSTDLDYIISYINEVKFINIISNSVNPLKDFSENIIKYVEDKNKENIYELVKNYYIFKKLYSKNDYEKNIIYSLINKYQDNFKQGNYILEEDIIKKLSIDKVFRVGYLSKENRSNLIDCLIMLYLNDNIDLINLYFGIGDTRFRSNNKNAVRDLEKSKAEKEILIDTIEKTESFKNETMQVLNKNNSIMMEGIKLIDLHLRSKNEDSQHNEEILKREYANISNLIEESINLNNRTIDTLVKSNKMIIFINLIIVIIITILFVF